MPSNSEVERLEQMWGGGFGDDYVDRNMDSYDHRAPFWDALIDDIQPRSVLEVGCNIGGNLQWISKRLYPGDVYGVDVNQKALSTLHKRLPDVNALRSPARNLPFRDRWFDLVLTMGVLIHQPDTTLPLVMSEMVRCSSNWVLCGEYYADETLEVPYRGETGALFKRDYGRLFAELFPELEPVKQGYLGRDSGWDDVTWWLFRKVDRGASPGPSS